MEHFNYTLEILKNALNIRLNDGPEEFIDYKTFGKCVNDLCVAIDTLNYYKDEFRGGLKE